MGAILPTAAAVDERAVIVNDEDHAWLNGRANGEEKKKQHRKGREKLHMLHRSVKASSRKLRDFEYLQRALVAFACHL